jgi:phosphoglycolate phosphatase
MTETKKTKDVALILDFDGVIADSFYIFVEALEEVLKLKPLSKNEVEELRGSSNKQILDRLGVKKWQLPRLAAQGRRKIAKKMEVVTIFEGMPEAVKQASMQNKVYILSSNDNKAITRLLDKVDLTRHIENIYSGTSIFGKAKRLNT